MFDDLTLVDLNCFQEHEFFYVSKLKDKIVRKCLLPTRVLQDLILISPNYTKKCKRLESVVLDIEDYSVEERSCFDNAVNFLKETLPKTKHLKPFRLSKVTSKTIISSFINDV